MFHAKHFPQTIDLTSFFLLLLFFHEYLPSTDLPNILIENIYMCLYLGVSDIAYKIWIKFFNSHVKSI